MHRVADLMAADLLTVDAGTSLTSAVQRMHERRVGAVLVLEGERLVGVFTERDVLRAVAQGLTDETTVGDWMTRGPETIESTDSADHAAVLMIHGGFRHLPGGRRWRRRGDPLDPRSGTGRARRRGAARRLRASFRNALRLLPRAGRGR